MEGSTCVVCCLLLDAALSMKWFLCIYSYYPVELSLGGGSIEQSFQKALNESCKTAFET